MTEQTLENTRTVEVFLNALADEDFDTANAALADDLVYQNVGLPTIYGRHRAMKLFRRMEGRAGFDVKIHRIAGILLFIAGQTDQGQLLHDDVTDFAFLLLGVLAQRERGVVIEVHRPEHA
ncbi:limonene-1,2-epoxide hydrolase family protein, partial [Mycobacterium celatum]|uniref:limonene-1,2-epoxide hydrolase family protein n=1 Tax=Mycobacterium celatum TaxID=28045 RepID=UPI0018DECA86